jgi:predicted RNA polymerase sigma factor
MIRHVLSRVAFASASTAAKCSRHWSEEVLDQLDGLPALSGYHLLPSVRGDLLDKLGRHEEARAEFARAATMTQNEQERKLLLNRASGRSAGQASP